MIPLSSVTPYLQEYLKKMNVNVDADNCVTEEQLNQARRNYLQSLIQQEKGELGDMETSVLDSLQRRELVSPPVDDEKTMTFGDRLADNMAKFGGSWTFIILFTVVLAGWILINGLEGEKKALDPFPFIFLNLILSCLAAVQAPIIMMSQNRQGLKDRKQAESDYKVNLKSEIEIRALHDKMDRLVTNQWQRLMAIQEMQMDLMEEIRNDHRADTAATAPVGPSPTPPSKA